MREFQNSPIQTARVPRGTTEEPKQPSAPRFRHRNLSLLFPILSLILVLLGSGGIVAEIFHTGLVFDQGHADYVKAADRASGEGIALLHASTSKSIGDRDAQIAEATNEAAGIRFASKSEVDKTRTEWAFTVQPRVVLERANLHQLERGRHKFLSLVRAIFISIQEAARKEFKDANYSLRVGFMAFDGKGIPRQRLFPVPWTDQQSLQILMFNCVNFPGVNDHECGEEIDDRMKGPEDVSIARSSDHMEAPLVVERPSMRLFEEYGAALVDLERVVFYNALDVERFRGGTPNASIDILAPINSERGRLRLGLAAVRRRLQLLRDLQSTLNLPVGDDLRAILLKEIAPSFAKDLNRIERSAAATAGAWISESVPQYIAAAHRERERELTTRSSDFYRRIRPLLGNVWQGAESGSIAIGSWGFNSTGRVPHDAIPGSFERQQTALQRDRSIPLWLLVLAGCGSVATMLGVLWRQGMLFSSWLALFLVPVCLLALLFPVRVAFNVNSATINRAESLAADIIAHTVQGHYTARAAALQAELYSGGKGLASGIQSQAKAEGAVLVNVASQRKEEGLNRLLMISTGIFSQVSLAEQIVFWTEHVSASSPLKKLDCFLDLSRQAMTFEREHKLYLLPNPSPRFSPEFSR